MYKRQRSDDGETRFHILAHVYRNPPEDGSCVLRSEKGLSRREARIVDRALVGELMQRLRGSANKISDIIDFTWIVEIRRVVEIGVPN